MSAAAARSRPSGHNRVALGLIAENVAPGGPAPPEPLWPRPAYAGGMAQTALRFIFISEADKPVVSITSPEDMLFQEVFVMAAKKLGKDAAVLSATYPGGSSITGGTVKEVAEKSANIHVIDPSLVGTAARVR